MAPEDLTKELLEAVAIICARLGGKAIIPAVRITHEVLGDLNGTLNPVGVRAEVSMFNRLFNSLDKDQSVFGGPPEYLVFRPVP